MKGKRYQHRKGGAYVVIDLAEHAETGESMVVYRRESDGSVFVRPRSMFDDGRFTLLEAAASHDSERVEFMVAIWTDGEPPIVKLRPFGPDDLVTAAKHAREAGWQWTETYLLHVIAGPGPVGHRTIEQIADGIVPWPLDDKALAIELRRELSDTQTKLRDAELDAERMRAELNTPHTADFLKAVNIEAAHQRARWGTELDAGKSAADWFWLIGYLAGKALEAWKRGDTAKLLHHIVTTAASLLNWHANAIGDDTRMRPGIEPPPEVDPHG